MRVLSVGEIRDRLAALGLDGWRQWAAAVRPLAAQGLDREDLLTLAMSLEGHGRGASDGVLAVIEELEAADAARQAAAQVQIVSFGYGHGPAPAVHLIVDVRHHFRDPHADPALRELTAADQRVVHAVLETSGVRALVRSIVLAAGAFLAGPGAGPVVVAVGCVGGRHRSPVVAVAAAQMLRHEGTRVSVTHRDLDRPVIERLAGSTS